MEDEDESASGGMLGPATISDTCARWVGVDWAGQPTGATPPLAFCTGPGSAGSLVQLGQLTGHTTSGSVQPGVSFTTVMGTPHTDNDLFYRQLVAAFGPARLPPSPQPSAAERIREFIRITERGTDDEAAAWIAAEAVAKRGDYG